MSFEPNLGQTDPAVDFLARGGGYTLFLTHGEAVFTLRSAEPASEKRFAGRDARATWKGAARKGATPAGKVNVLRMQLVGDDPRAQPGADGKLAGTVNYFIGNDPAQWRAGIPTYGRVTYPGVYPGVDLVYYGTQGRLEYDFVVQPGADPTAIGLRYEGAEAAEVDARGDLVLRLPGEEIRQTKPLIYQDIDGARQQVSGGYRLRDDGTIGFDVGAYERDRTLVIDPTLFYSTYAGGSLGDNGVGIAVDSVFNAYVTGITGSGNFPTTTGAFQTTALSGSAFVTKLNPTGSGLVYSTYLGGNGDVGLGIAVDSAFSAYVTGITQSRNFPTTTGAFQTAFLGNSDGFVTKLNTTGSALVYSTFLGGTDEDSGYGIAVDSAFSAYVTGRTRSTDFPTTTGAFQTAFVGNVLLGENDAFVTKLNPAGNGLVYSTYLGGSGTFGQGIALDSTLGAYVTGFTVSPNFPTTTGAVQTAAGGANDAFVTKLDPAGSALVYSTYLGGSGEDAGTGIAVDSSFSAYATGDTQSANFPTTTGAFQTAFPGADNAFVTKLNVTGTALVYSTYLGGSGNDFGNGIALDSTLSAYVIGSTESANFPTTTGAFRAALLGLNDAFVTKLNGTGTALVFSTYLGGSGEDLGFGIAVDSAFSAYVTGATNSTNFPTTTGAFQTTSAGDQDVFVSKIIDIVLPPAPVAKVTGGGSINVTGGIGTFSFIVQRKETGGPVSGQLQYLNHTSGARVSSVSFTSLVIAGNTAGFGGTCTNNGLSCTFTVNVTDNGEPGTTDTFTISVDGPAEGGVLRSGNIQIHH